MPRKMKRWSGEEKKKRQTKAAWPFWSGTVSFGLINIPVRLYSATQERNLNLDMLRKRDLCPINFARVCRATGEEVPLDEIVKGYQYQKVHAWKNIHEFHESSLNKLRDHSWNSWTMER